MQITKIFVAIKNNISDLLVTANFCEINFRKKRYQVTHS